MNNPHAFTHHELGVDIKAMTDAIEFVFDVHTRLEPQISHARITSHASFRLESIQPEQVLTELWYWLRAIETYVWQCAVEFGRMDNICRFSWTKTQGRQGALVVAINGSQTLLSIDLPARSLLTAFSSRLSELKVRQALHLIDT